MLALRCTARGASWVAALLALIGCADPTPAAPGRDGGRRVRDGSVELVDDGGLDPALSGRLDGGPRLPPADRTVVLPFEGDAIEEPLEVEAEVGMLDVFFSIDTTGSFGGEIANLQAELRSRIVPELRRRVADVAFGVGRFEDFPAAPWGAPGDRPFRLVTGVTTDETRVASGVASLNQPLGNGGDIPESGAEALYQIATGAGYPGQIPRYSGVPAPGGGSLGGVGFRREALKVVVHVTDAPTQEPASYGSAFPGTRSLAQAVAALNALGVRGIGIASGPPARPYLETLALGTGGLVDPVGGLCRTGIDGALRSATGGRCPLVFDVRSDGSGLSAAVVDAIADLLGTVRYDEVWGETDDRLGFVRAIEAVSATVPSGAPPVARADLRPRDGVEDTFVSVGPGGRLRFRAILRNETIPPADYDQYFNLTLTILGDGVTLASRRVRVTVPRGRLEP